MITIIVFEPPKGYALYLSASALCHLPLHHHPDHYPACCPTCKNAQKASYTQKHAIILYYYGMFQYGGLIYIIFHRGFCPKVGMCSTHTPTSKLYQIFTQFTQSPQIHFDSHFDKILKIQAKINFLTI